MNPKTEELLHRTFEFGVYALKYLQKLPKDKVYSVITYQLAKSSTSIGANYEEAQGAESIDDFTHKIGICVKESRESNYWLRLLKELINEHSLLNDNSKLIKESDELKKIFISIKLSAQKNKKS
ncbi:MAG: four helix bundle protein [Ignavibacteria bacterium]|nr:four helix bundle protein [Ignavibacteria bacterium]